MRGARMEDIRILIVDDATPMRELLQLNLKKEGYVADEASNGIEAIKKIKEKSYSLVLLDVMMPEMDGFEVCGKIRNISQVPIIMLTARTHTIDKVEGLRLGADDYITKPFEQVELLARIEAVLRRYGGGDQKLNGNTLSFNGLVMKKEAHQVFYLEKELSLTPKEYAILELVLLNRNRVFSRDDILELVWGYDFIGDYRGVDTHVKHLRDKLTEAGISGQSVIKTVWGVGYKSG